MAARAWFLVAVLTGCAGCSTDSVIEVMQENFITFKHPFTDGAAADVRRRAGSLCEQRKQAAVKTENVCSLEKCTTTYQCMDKADAATYGQ